MPRSLGSPVPPSLALTSLLPTSPGGASLVSLTLVGPSAGLPLPVLHSFLTAKWRIILVANRRASAEVLARHCCLLLLFKQPTLPPPTSWQERVLRGLLLRSRSAGRATNLMRRSQRRSRQIQVRYRRLRPFLRLRLNRTARKRRKERGTRRTRWTRREAKEIGNRKKKARGTKRIMGAIKGGGEFNKS